MQHSRLNNQTSDIPRHGFLLVELIVSMILLGTVAAVLPVTLNAIYKQRQQERFERMAQLELSNLVTRLRTHDTNPQLSVWFQEMYPEASVEISTNQQTDAMAIDPTTISIRHEQSDSQPPLQQTLKTWIERQESGE